uniref:Phosphodiesterase n=1 Tax=Eutreptiella gymnastica TaxID=73025 RepID=A0A7S1NG74_9EUGL|mmetsp:Transcript_30958/g.55609  ORF Transcript_30958/g.55609 Transcript_30958/m.55609 type:complete len:2923 (+) Transcript_30958:120-8888(+)
MMSQANGETATFRYLQSHGILFTFDELFKALFDQTPEEPLEFVAEFIQQRLDAKRANRARPSSGNGHTKASFATALRSETAVSTGGLSPGSLSGTDASPRPKGGLQLPIDKMDYEALFKLVSRDTKKLTGAAQCSLYIIHKKGSAGQLLVCKDGSIGHHVPLSGGIAGHVATSGRTVNVKNATQNGMFDGKIDLPADSLLCVPIFENLGVIGVLQLANKEGGFQAEDADAVATYASQVGTLVYNCHAFITVQTQRNEAAMILAMIKPLGPAESSPKTCVRLITDHSRQLTGADKCFLFMMDPTRTYLQGVVAPDKQVRVPVGSGIVGTVAQSGAPVLLGQAADHPNFDPKFDEEYSEEKLYCVPLLAHRSVEAVVLFLREKTPFQEENIDSFGIYASSAGVALHNCRRHQQLKDQEKKNNILVEVLGRVSETDLRRPEDVIEQIVVGAQQLLEADRCTLFVVDKERNQLCSRIATKTGGKEIRFPINQGIAGEVVRTKLPLKISNAYSDPRFNRDIDRELNYRTDSILSYPVLREGEIVAVVQLINKKGGQDFTEQDEEIMHYFAMFAGISLANASLVEFFKNSAEGSMSLIKTMQRDGRRTSIADKATNDADAGYYQRILAMEIDDDEVAWLKETELDAEELALVKTYDFDIHKYKDPTIRHKIVPLLVSLMDDLGIVQALGVDKHILFKFLIRVQMLYRQVPYHNWYHAADVLQTMYLFLKSVRGTQIFNIVDEYVLLISAALHDVDHMGLNNSFHLKTETPMGILMNCTGSMSVLEIHHCNISMEVLGDPATNAFHSISEKERVYCFKTLINVILATDMARHGEISKAFKELPKLAEETEEGKAEHKLQFMQMLIKGCDVSNVIKPFGVAKHWADAVTEEFYTQGDMEKEKGFDILPMFDRQKADLAKGQVGFIDFLASHQFAAMADWHPGLEWTRKGFQEVRARWAQVIEEQAAKQKEEEERKKLEEEQVNQLQAEQDAQKAEEERKARENKEREQKLLQKARVMEGQQVFVNEALKTSELFMSVESKYIEEAKNLSTAVSGIDNTSCVLAMMTHAMNLTAADDAVLCILRKDSTSRMWRWTRDGTSSSPRTSIGFIGTVLATGVPLEIKEKAHKDPRYHSDADCQGGQPWHLCCVPIRYQGSVVAVLQVATTMPDRVLTVCPRFTACTSPLSPPSPLSPDDPKSPVRTSAVRIVEPEPETQKSPKSPSAQKSARSDSLVPASPLLGRAQEFQTAFGTLKASFVETYAGVGIHNCQVYEQMRAQRDRVAMVLAMIKPLSEAGLQAGTLERLIAEHTQFISGAGHSLLLLIDESGDQMRVASEDVDLTIPMEGSIPAVVVAEGHSLRCLRACDDPNYSDHDHRLGYRSESIMVTPIYSGDRIVGVAVMREKLKEPKFTEDDEEAISIYANFAGIALRNCQTYENIKSQTRKNDVLVDVLGQLNQADLTNVDEVIEKIMTGAQRLLHAERCTLFCVDKERNQLYSRVATKTGGKEIRFSMNQGIAGECARNQTPLNIKDPYNDPRFNKEVDKELGFITHSILAFPVVRDNEVVAVVQVINKDQEVQEFTQEDEEIMGYFAIFAGISLANARMLEFATASSEDAMRMMNMMQSGRRKGNKKKDHEGKDLRKMDKEGMQAVSTDWQEVLTIPITGTDVEQVQAVELTEEEVQAVRTFQFNVHEYKAADKHAKVIPLLMSLVDAIGAIEEFELDRTILIRFFIRVRMLYRQVPYHNWFHAVDVVQTMYLFIQSLEDDHVFTTLDKYVLLISAVLHDVDHMGLNNSFHLKTETPMGILVNCTGSLSVLEIHHCNIAMEVLSNMDTDAFHSLTDSQRTYSFKHLVHIILATDMAKHGEISKKFKELPVLAEDNEREAHKLQYMQMLIKSCDVSNVMKPFDVARDWAIAVTEEFYTQGDMEKEKGLSVMAMFDRQQANLSKGQIGFIDFLAAHQFNAMADWHPGFEWTREGFRNVRERWAQIAAEYAEIEGKPKDSASDGTSADRRTSLSVAGKEDEEAHDLLDDLASPQLKSVTSLSGGKFPYGHGRAINQSRQASVDRTTLVKAIMTDAQSLTGAAQCSVYIVDEPNGRMFAYYDDVTTSWVPTDSGIAGYVARTGQTVNVVDAYRDSRFDMGIDSHWFRPNAMLCLPLFLKPDGTGEVIAVLQLVNKYGGPVFSQRDEEAFTSYVEHTGFVFRSCCAIEHLDTQRKRVAMVLSMMRPLALAEILGDQLLTLIGQRAQQLTHTHKCHVFVVDSRSRFLHGKLGLKKVDIPVGCGIPGIVAATGKTIECSPASRHPDYDPDVDHAIGGWAEESLICCPIIAMGEVVGVAVHILKAGNEPDMEAFRVYCDFAGTSLRNGRLHSLLESQKRKNDMLVDMLKQLSSSDLRNVDGIINTIMTGAQQLLEAERCTLFCVDLEHNQLYSKMALNIDKEIRFKMTEGIAGEVVRTKLPLNIGDPYADPRFNQEIDKRLNFKTRSILAFPVIRAGEVVAVAQLINKEGAGGKFTEEDEELMEYFAMFAGISLANARLMEFAMNSGEDAMALVNMMQGQEATAPIARPKSAIGGAQARYRQALGRSINEDEINYLMAYEPTDEEKVMVKSQEFDVHFYKEKEHQHKVIPLLVELLHDVGAMDELKLDKPTLFRFFVRVQMLYRQVPYHNWFHAVDVVQTMYLFIRSLNGTEVFDTLDKYILLITAVLHDVDHMGLNNSFHLKAETPMGILVNCAGSLSVLEIHHCNIAMQVLSDPETNAFHSLTEEQKSYAFKHMITTILATDMARHGEISKAFKELPCLAEDADRTNQEHKSQFMQMMIKGCDVSNIMKPFPVARIWAVAVTEEFYTQGDMEKEKGLDVLPMFDRQKADLAKGQIGFIDFLASHQFNAMADWHPGFEWTREGYKAVRAVWAQISADAEKEKKEQEEREKQEAK